LKGNHFLRAVAAAVAAAILLVFAGAASAPSAKSAILIDQTTGRVLYEKNADERRLIASTTKIMTGLLVCERGDLDARVPIPPEAVGIEGSSMCLKAGQTRTVRELLYGMLLISGNDAAVALALHEDGSVPGFVARMNRKAASLGLQSTHFANPNGLDDEGNYSTARELAKIAREALKNETFRAAVSTKSIEIGDRTLTNHNKLLWRCEGAIGVKTGYTKAAGRILVSAAARNGRTLVCVTLSDPDDWRDHEALLDYGFGLLKEKTILRPGQIVGSVPVVSGRRNSVPLRAAAGLSCRLYDGETVSLRVLAPSFVYAPVRAGEPAGALEILLDGEVYCRQTLYYAAGTPLKAAEKSFWQRLFGG
jgi:D-alanyl-D-alanine carboxypeptidase (penicillin-binding protein 5/6)